MATLGPLPGIDPDDILRSALVFSVSALDTYMHDVIREGMLDIFTGSRPRTKSYDAFMISLATLHAHLGAATVTTIWIEQEVRRILGFRTFQKSEKIAEGFSLISDSKLFSTLASRMRKRAEEIRKELDVIVDRRNKIAHEADLDGTLPGSRWPITTADVSNAANFIERVVNVAHSLL